MSSRLRRTAGSLLAAATLVCAAASCTNAEPPRTPVAKPPGDTVEETSVTVPAVSAPPSVTVETPVDGLDHPWDVVRAPDGTLLTGARVRNAHSPETLTVDLEIGKVVQTVLPGGRAASRLSCRILTEREQLEKMIRLFNVDLQ